MGKIIAAVFVLATAGIVAYTIALGGGAKYDVTTAAQPLGTLDQAAAWLKEHTFEDDPVDKNSGNGPEGTTRHRYMEIYAGDAAQFLCMVDLYVDSGGGVRKIFIEFPSKSRNVDPEFTRAQGMAYSLWAERSGSAPTFAPDTISKRIGAPGIRADFSAGGVKGSWVKAYTDGDFDHSIVDYVTFERQ